MLLFAVTAFLLFFHGQTLCMKKVFTMALRHAARMCRVGEKTISCDMCALGGKLRNLVPTSGSCGKFVSEERKQKQEEKKQGKKEDEDWFILEYVDDDGQPHHLYFSRHLHDDGCL